MASKTLLLACYLRILALLPNKWKTTWLAKICLGLSFLRTMLIHLPIAEENVKLLWFFFIIEGDLYFLLWYLVMHFLKLNNTTKAYLVYHAIIIFWPRFAFQSPDSLMPLIQDFFLFFYFYYYYVLLSCNLATNFIYVSCTYFVSTTALICLMCSLIILSFFLEIM